MNESDNFGLVPRSPGVLEKTEPGAKRILSGMVAETLALMKKEPPHSLERWFENGTACFKSENYVDAVRWLRKASEQGCAKSQYVLGNCYLRGLGVTTSEDDGVAWLKKALDGGVGMAGFCLASHYQNSFLPNYSEAIKYYQKAAELGYERGAGNLAKILERLAKADETPAIQKSAELGDADACFEMGIRCLEGLGVSQSANEAFRWFRRAAEKGENAQAWSYMGIMLEDGRGAPRNLSEAISCFRRASELGDDYAYGRLLELNVLD